MKTILFVAPGVSPPLTEGRKLFVTELAETLNDRGQPAAVLSGAPVRSGVAAIHASLRELQQRCASRAPVAAVVTFPYGTYRGIRAWANDWLIQRARVISAANGAPMIPLFYSCAGMGLDELDRRYGPAVIVGRHGGRSSLIHLGTRRALPSWQPSSGQLQRLLFLCGYQKATRTAWHDVLMRRGLIDLLRAGDALAHSGVRLTVAIPFLRDARMRGMLKDVAAKLCLRLSIEALGEVDPLALLAEHDAFAFPYREESSVFIPTSLLEALSLGIPTIAADHAMYRALTVGPEGERCFLHRIGDADDLAAKVETMCRGYGATVTRAAHAAAGVCEEWSIERSADELLDAIKQQGG